MHKYPAIVHKEKNSAYGVSFPDFPGCISAGKSLDEASENAEKALLFHIKGMIEDGETIKTPSTLKKAEKLLKQLNGLLLVRIPVEIPTRTRRINISIEEGLLEMIDKCAKKKGTNRSRFLADAAIRMCKE